MVSKQKILIVDDDNNIAELISLYLTKECFDTMTETEKGRMLKVTDFPDRAGSIDGKFVITDEIENGNGKPGIKGTNYDVWGIGEDESGTYVIESARGDKFYIEGGKKVTVSHPNKGRKKEAMELIHEIYKMLV